ncbi:phenylacetate--CoA ligase family protein (plasmid) [Rubrobacter marinus]|uniref:Phenylacetate--CoA ligase family protein n=1 Tax=Rubrobacter marinus TaxID=2653852 RepID=A0A6G8Q3K8_9ACTN|nr:phenylacetate--CoA ligase family protein [Rubrobacter marinus]QIN81084.1 phenylacetate--CoA ligase family protein [Rubrobacter marinus]
MSVNLPRLLLDARKARRGGPAAIALRRRARLAEMVAFARECSPHYRELYRGLPERVEDVALLPVTSKGDLMARFDGWVSDPEATIEKARAFADDPGLVGERFLGKYLLATTSGTTGTRGIFLVDDRAVAVRNALLLSRGVGAWLGARDLAKILAGGGRTATVIATGGHFAGLAGASGTVRGGGRWRGDAVRVFPVHAPLPELVSGLNRFRPAVLAGYASAIALLAGEQEAGRLRIDPALVLLAAEGLAEGGQERIAGAFGAKVGNVYAATECLHIGHGCAHGWLHVNADWAVLEPVDAHRDPVSPGEYSHTVLLTNLANRVQPVLRYDLGDGVLMRPAPCPCGDPLPAIRVEGRAADVLTFPAGPAEGVGSVAVPPLAFGSLVDRTPGVELFQIVQTAPTRLSVRLLPAPGADPERVWRAVRAEVARLLSEHGLGHVAVERAEEPPEQSPGGKYRTIVPMT